MNGTILNITNEERAVQEQRDFLQQLQFGISITVTVILLLCSAAYGRYLLKQIDKWDEAQMIKEIDQLDNEPESVI